MAWIAPGACLVLVHHLRHARIVRAAEAIGESGVLDTAPVTAAITDYYLTNPIARASETMAKCSQEFVGATKMAAE